MKRKLKMMFLGLCMAMLLAGNISVYQAAAAQTTSKDQAGVEKPGRVSLKSVSVVSGDNMRITWNPVSGAQRYQIYRKQSGTWKKIGTCKSTKLSYTDKTTLVGAKYQYRVRAYAKIGGKAVYGTFSKASAVVTQNFYGKSVSISSVKSSDPKTMEIKWKARAKATGYVIYRRTEDTAWKKIKTVKKVTSYTDKNLVGGTAYYYTVRALSKANAKAGITKTLYSIYNKNGVKAVAMRDKWEQLLYDYSSDGETNQLAFVKYTGGSSAKVEMYQKSRTDWTCILACDGYVGANGIGKQIEGDRKTPTGTFNLTSAFGIKKNPGAKMSYVRVNKYLYWCGDAQYYNRLVDVREKPHVCSGEHLIDYVPHYYYGMFLDYNKDCVYKKGSAIFLHCTGSNPYTGGCIAVSQDNMIKIIQNAEPGAKICIYSM